MSMLMLASGCRRGGCYDNSDVIELDETTPLGITPQQMLDDTLRSFTAMGEWWDESEVEVMLTLANPGEARWVEPRVVTNRQSIYRICPNRVEVDVDVALSTDDGGLDELWPGVVSFSDPDADPMPDADDEQMPYEVRAIPSLDSINGTVDIASLEPADHHIVDDELYANLGETAFQGGWWLQWRRDRDCAEGAGLCENNQSIQVLQW